MFILYTNMILVYKLNISFINIFACYNIYISTKIYYYFISDHYLLCLKHFKTSNGTKRNC
jgi:hypothetical protein